MTTMKKEGVLFAAGSLVENIHDIFKNEWGSRVDLNTCRWQQRLPVFPRSVITIHSTNQGTYQHRTYEDRFRLMYTHGCREWNIYLYMTLLRNLSVAVITEQDAAVISLITLSSLYVSFHLYNQQV